jgi:hypothetical protein
VCQIDQTSKEDICALPWFCGKLGSLPSRGNCECGMCFIIEKLCVLIGTVELTCGDVIDIKFAIEDQSLDQ